MTTRIITALIALPLASMIFMYGMVVDTIFPWYGKKLKRQNYLTLQMFVFLTTPMHKVKMLLYIECMYGSKATGYIMEASKKSLNTALFIRRLMACGTLPLGNISKMVQQLVLINSLYMTLFILPTVSAIYMARALHFKPETRYARNFFIPDHITSIKSERICS